MSRRPSDQALTDPERKLPAAPESPDTFQPPGAAALEANVRVSLEPSPADVLEKMKRDERKSP